MALAKFLYRFVIKCDAPRFFVLYFLRHHVNLHYLMVIGLVLAARLKLVMDDT